jgi:hypothetical protein
MSLQDFLVALLPQKKIDYSKLSTTIWGKEIKRLNDYKD